MFYFLYVDEEFNEKKWKEDTQISLCFVLKNNSLNIVQTRNKYIKNLYKKKVNTAEKKLKKKVLKIYKLIKIIM